MKTYISLFVSLSILVILTSGCEESTTHIPNNNPLVFSGQLTDNTECKVFKSTLTSSETPDTLSCIEYSFNADNNKLYITHINTAFNCCPDSLYCNISLHEDTIIIEEFEKEPQCYCNCLYDLNIELTGIESKTYLIKIVEPYLSEEEELNFVLDLALTPEDKYCVTRKNYPWGITDYGSGSSSNITGELLGTTGCLEFKSTLSEENIADTLSCVFFTYVEQEKELILTHYNTGFNCCPDELFINTSLEGDTIIIAEGEKDGLCDCLCLFNFNIKIDGVEPKIYVIEFIEPYATDEEKLHFQIDLGYYNEGSFCVNRKNYPWGMSLYL